MGHTIPTSVAVIRGGRVKNVFSLPSPLCPAHPWLPCRQAGFDAEEEGEPALWRRFAPGSGTGGRAEGRREDEQKTTEPPSKKRRIGKAGGSPPPAPSVNSLPRSRPGSRAPVGRWSAGGSVRRRRVRRFFTRRRVGWGVGRGRRLGRLPCRRAGERPQHAVQVLHHGAGLHPEDVPARGTGDPELQLLVGHRS